MELTEAVHRVLVRHLKLIVVCVLLGAMVGVAFHVGDVRLYSSTTRLVLDAPDPDSQAASQVLADTARGIATSVETVRRALKLASEELGLGEQGLARDPLELAQHHVQVEALGSSGVLALTVTDPDPRSAVVLSKGLAQALIETRDELNAGRSATVLADLVVRIDSLTARIAAMDEKIIALDLEIDGSNSQLTVLGLESQRSDIVRQLSDLTNRRALLVAERAKVASDQALRPQAGIVDPARSPAEPVPSRTISDTALGAILGLLVGVALAALIETFRPTIVGRSSFERETGAPLLGELAATPNRVSPREVQPVASYAALAARTANVSRIELIGADGTFDLHPLAQKLDSAIAVPTSGNGRVVTVASFGPPGSGNGASLSPAAPASERGNGRPGLILVAPAAMKRASLEPILDFKSISGMQLIGVINYRRRGLFKRSRSARTTPIPEPVAPVSADPRSDIEQPDFDSV